ncbi:unnamed protein product [Paramecium sonneborni]|uniref:Uncharacterized protein n=1 Tax=Paramecium sonneborni TaxID=65129 RepID=A0A8S1NUL9_9CILI|nr:unnamed protein product [Paramecium sonneborni]
MFKVQDIVNGWEIENSPDFGDIFQSLKIQIYSKPQEQIENEKQVQKVIKLKEIEIPRERKQRVKSSYFEQQIVSNKKEQRLKLYPIQHISLVQPGQLPYRDQNNSILTHRFKQANSLNYAMRRKSAYLQSILKQVNYLVNEKRFTKLRSGSVMSVNQSPRWFGTPNLYNKYIQ